MGPLPKLGVLHETKYRPLSYNFSWWSHIYTSEVEGEWKQRISSDNCPCLLDDLLTKFVLHLYRKVKLKKTVNYLKLFMRSGLSGKSSQWLTLQQPWRKVSSKLNAIKKKIMEVSPKIYRKETEITGIEKRYPFIAVWVSLLLLSFHRLTAVCKTLSIWTYAMSI